MDKAARRQILIRGYKDAGDSFLALTLAKIFNEIKTPEDTALHNDAVKNILLMVDESSDWWRTYFIMEVVRILLFWKKPKSVRQAFFRRMAGKLLEIASRAKKAKG